MANAANGIDEGAEVVEYSPNDVFNCLVDKDPTAEIAGFVSELNAPRDVGVRNQYRLFKFALSNGDDADSKKIYCCVWGHELISKIGPGILPNRIVQVSGATTKASKPSFTQVNEGFVPFELNIGSSTDVTFHGTHAAVEPVINNIPTDVNVENIAAQENGSLVNISGYLRQPFRVIQNRYGNSSYGNSAITNGTEKVNVNITNYAPLNIPLGLLISVSGILENENNGGPTTIICRDIASIVPDPEGRRMENHELKRGNRFPKRKAPAV